VGSEGTSDFDEVARELIAMYHCSVKSLLVPTRHKSQGKRC